MATSTIDAVGSSAMVTVPLTVSKRPRTRPTTRCWALKPTKVCTGRSRRHSLGHQRVVDTRLWSAGAWVNTPLLAGMVP